MGIQGGRDWKQEAVSCTTSIVKQGKRVCVCSLAWAQILFSTLTLFRTPCLENSATHSGLSFSVTSLLIKIIIDTVIGQLNVNTSSLIGLLPEDSRLCKISRSILCWVDLLPFSLLAVSNSVFSLKSRLVWNGAKHHTLSCSECLRCQVYQEQSVSSFGSLED